MSATLDLTALLGLEPVGLEELIALADLQARRDRKYLVPRTVVNALVEQSGAGTRALTIGGAQSFRYESTYFDTCDLASYLGAARRRPRRFKVRTRTYLDSGGCMLEVKTRDARGHTIKHRRPYELEHRGELTAAGREFVASVDQAAAAAPALTSTLTTSYRRATLLLAGARARATVDVDLAWSDGRGRRCELTDLALVETKSAGPPCDLDRALWRVGARPITISKYCTGLAALRGDVPANTWNRVLRRHFGWSRSSVG